LCARLLAPGYSRAASTGWSASHGSFRQLAPASGTQQGHRHPPARRRPRQSHRPICFQTFTDANPQSAAESFSLVVQWGDGALNTSADTDANNYPYVWITENETTHEFQVRGHHGFPTPGAYQIDVRVLENEHSRAAATSTVTIGQPPPPWPPLYDTWIRMYCDGSSVMGTGGQPLDFNVLDQTVRTFGTTVRGDAGEALNSVVLASYTFLDAGRTPATATATVQWTPGGDWEPATVSGGTVMGSHTYATPGSWAIVFRAPVDDVQRAAAPTFNDSGSMKHVGDDRVPGPRFMRSGQLLRRS